MMTMNKLMAFLIVWAIALLVCNVADGMFLGNPSTGLAAWFNETIGFGVSAAGGVTNPVVGAGFLASLGTVFTWNYACLEGGMLPVRVFLLLWSATATFGLAQIGLNTVTGIFRR